MIRIFVDAHCFDREYQGTRTFIREIYSSLLHKQDLILYLGAYDIEKLQSIFPPKNNIVFVRYTSRSPLIRLTYDIPRLVRKYKIDYAHFQYIAPLFKNCKQVLTMHDVLFRQHPEQFPFYYRWIRRVLFKRSARRADIFTTVSDFSKKTISDSLNISEAKIHVVANGVSKRFFADYDQEETRQEIQKKYGFRKFILYVSRIEPRKNHALLLRSYLDLKLYQKGYYLVLLGHQSISAPAFSGILNSLDTKTRRFIFLKSDTDDKELLEFYRAAEFFVYPSRAEGFGLPPLEAAATRVPVLCSNASAMSSFTFFGEGHVSPFKENDFTKKLKQMAERNKDEKTLIQISETLRRNYSWDRSAEQLYQLIAQDSLTHSSPS